MLFFSDIRLSLEMVDVVEPNQLFVRLYKTIIVRLCINKVLSA